MISRRSSTAGELSELLKTLRTPSASESQATAEVKGTRFPTATAESNSAPARAVRTPGKRSDPGYRLTGVYLPRALTDDVRRQLVGSQDLNLSDLVTKLLRQWLASQRSLDQQ